MSQRSSFAGPNQRTLALNAMINAPPRPLEPDLSSAGVSLAAPSPGLTDFRDLQSTSHLTRSSNTDNASMRPPGQQQTPLGVWYTSHVGPWDPIHGRAQTNLQAKGKLNYRSNEASFLDYRSTYNSPSECETTAPGHLPSDSGYGSLTRHSVAEGSLYGDCDRSGDTASVSSHLAGIHLDRTRVSPPDTWRQQPAVHESFMPIDASRLVCPHCKERVKTKSELKKHEQKHTKPYRCKAPNCPRPEGFSTPNDVERHMRSCHPEISSKGKCYNCTVANCRSKDKKWPRADNFRQHLKRVHGIQPGDDDLEKFVYKPQASPGPDLAGLGTSVGGGLISLNIDPDGLGSNPWPFSMQPIQEQASRDPCELSDYMDFQREAAIAQQHLAMSRAGHHVPSNLMELLPLELDADSPLTQMEQAHSQSQELQDYTASSIGDQETNFEESNYFTTISDHESVDDDEHSVIQHISEPDTTPDQDVCKEPRALEPSTQSLAEPSADSLYHAAPHSITTVDDEGSSTTSTSPASSSSCADQFMPTAPDATVSPELQGSDAAASSELQTNGTRLDFSDVIKDEDRAYDLIKALKERGLLAGLLEKVDYQKPKDVDATSKTEPSIRSDVSRNIHACPRAECKKAFPRLCELRKHIKRHAKPYGCTFPRCVKRFGSKNDWKRHENSQHFQLELWKCNVKSKLDIGELCNRPYSRREQFKTHLLKDHGITDAAEVDRKLEDCLDGRNYEVRFWCGFCRKIVKVKERGLKAWLGRFNHIDDHFSCLMDISDWQSPGPGLREVDVCLAGFSETSHGGSQNTAASLPAGAGRGGRLSKRGADGEAQQSRPPKKSRPSAVWYCCGCGGQSITGFSAACLTPRCRGHEQCGNCTSDAIPVDSFENDV